ncbi:hypothetical protein A1QY_00680 [Vibrio anguillarum]|uniref:4'-phosphopantetheinyl transferase family protein n=1 Tax=Vibrio anguillarum TaxID=55601 RepID=UPI000301D298|nr:4'-phosphopantetheinyl transferase superfamily protein [Vibrio anguillarum]OEF91355.1 hypothetical protein A1QY_00680 [Vibrio anguillarum]
MRFIFPVNEVKVGSEIIQMRNYDIFNFSEFFFEKERIDIPDSIRKSVKKRQAEFLAGRVVARDALQSIGFKKTINIPIGKSREPLWPLGVVGSISHTDSTAIALVKSKSPSVLVGLDIENFVTKSDCNDLEEIVINQVEHDRLKHLNISRSYIITLIFSAKETLFKAIYPEVRQYLNFLDSEVVFLCFETNVIRLRMIKNIVNVNFRNHYDINFRVINNSVITVLT